MKITITGGKGGTGKSMVATNLAVEFARQNRTMLVDADAECPNDHLLLSIKRKKHTVVYQPVPKWDFSKCSKCGKCASVCKQNAIIFVKGKYPAFVKDVCIGCKACIVSCALGAICEDKRAVGNIYLSESDKYDLTLVTGELNIGDLASGEIVADVRAESVKISKDKEIQHVVTDAAAGIGCPVIASIVNNDFVIAVTEPTPSAFSDLKRIVSLAVHFDIPIGIVINKYDLDEPFAKKIEEYAKDNKIKIMGKMRYDKDFVKSSAQAKVSDKKEHQAIIKTILSNI